MNRQEIQKKMRPIVHQLMREKGYASPVDIFLKMEKVSLKLVEEWRFGRVPYLERVMHGNLSQFSFIMKEFRKTAMEMGLQESCTTYMSWGKGKKQPLRFSKSGNPNIERLYSSHYKKNNDAHNVHDAVVSKKERPAVMEIKRDDLTGPEIAALIGEHLADMYEQSPPESVHALGLEKLREPGVTFWSAWVDGELAGCGALKVLGEGHAEVKSMRTAAGHRRKGVAKRILERLIEEASARGCRRLSLETGSMESFLPARRLYESFGFRYCGPFADYAEDPNSVFMMKELT